MAKAQLAILPIQEGRQAERRIVNLAARLRDPGASVADIEIQNLSISGFMAEGDIALEPGSHAWLRLSGLEPQNCRLVWVKDGKAGFEFANPLHPATIELLVAAGRKPIKKNHFGVQNGR
ncbi:pilus assembly protein PilZ [Sphingosinicella terrae]|uniref:pilus assembly protein PilZ n=1 Tax=Sphingosinicella terrae TaxID=2172047 RepID=UPI000E0DB571|nr:pilus assembly protein PilZ [Sphingosinicella terrae]